MAAFMALAAISISLWLAIQDYRSRSISLVWLLLLCLMCAVWACLQQPVKAVLFNTVCNAGLLLIQLLLLSVYFSIKNKSLTNIMDSYLGWGDVLFWLAIAPMFAPLTFFIQYLCGLLLAVLIYVPYKLLKPEANREIPLVTVSATVFVVCVAGNLIFGVPLNNDDWLIEKFAASL